MSILRPSRAAVFPDPIATMVPTTHPQFTLSTAQTKEFHQNGVTLVEGLVSAEEVDSLRHRFDCLFRGEFENGTMPDEVNWQAGKSDPSLARQICNGWRADRTVARTVLREDIACAVAGLMGWPGTRIMQDNVIYKPVGARSFNYHQDNAYLQWLEPGEICTVWIALDDIEARNGTMELIPGSHLWGLSEPEGTFHAPEDYRAPMKQRAQSIGVEPDILYVAVPRGDGSIHHGNIWHGSGPNLGHAPRRSLVIHAMPADVRYRREGFAQGTGPIYSRYAQLDSDHMDESYFPIVWHRSGYRTAGLDRYVRGAQ